MMGRKKKIVTAAVALTLAVGGVLLVKPKPHPARNTIYKIKNKNAGSTGTGFAIKDLRGRNFIVTNFHVCDFAGMRLSNYDEVEQEDNKTDLPIIVRPVLASAENDLCILSAPDDIPTLEISREGVQRGDKLTTLGHPLGGDMVVLTGTVISAEERVYLPVDPVMCGRSGGGGCFGIYESGLMTGRAQPGQSGSPVLNSKNEVVGIVFATDGQDTTMFISKDVLLMAVMFLSLME